ncbi:hypothetical protein SS50377_27519 [Spironucleus salmonicida]|uniref:Uncharacterized protein n=1 Tax=Spironucleus salmonicida TaxID=348837 RepID=V6LRJ5_9EUKA|nr:hypothetical protein SS50377_27519 [Spironucleus salmonicida]|eukprot:EST46888.1 Hypothetical protein SS50377_13041 [Spironucleus salmonicida]
MSFNSRDIYKKTYFGTNQQSQNKIFKQELSLDAMMQIQNQVDTSKFGNQKLIIAVLKQEQDVENKMKRGQFVLQNQNKSVAMQSKAILLQDLGAKKSVDQLNMIQDNISYLESSDSHLDSINIPPKLEIQINTLKILGGSVKTRQSEKTFIQKMVIQEATSPSTRIQYKPFVATHKQTRNQTYTSANNKVPLKFLEDKLDPTKISKRAVQLYKDIFK